jgi:hypothetical protein
MWNQPMKSNVTTPNVSNVIKEGSDEEVDNFHNYNETFKNIDALARKVLELNLYQYSNTSN